MIPWEQTKAELSSFVHDIFLENGYLEWRNNLKMLEEGRWYSLVVSLDKHNSPLDGINGFGNDVVSKLVFNYVKAPDYRNSKMLMIQFTVSGSLWHSTIWHCPERN